jgi:hypothetical protein
MSGRRSALISKVAQTDGHPKPGKAAQFAGMRHPDLRADRAPAPPARAPVWQASPPGRQRSKPGRSGHRRWLTSAAGTRAAQHAALRLPGAASGSPQGWQSCRTHRIFARPLCLHAFVVWSVVAGYDYPLIVIANRRPAHLALRPDRPPAPLCTSAGINHGRWAYSFQSLSSPEACKAFL